MKRIQSILVALLFSPLLFAQFYYETTPETPFEQGLSFALCDALEGGGKLSIHAAKYGGNILNVGMDFFLDDICKGKQHIIISYKIGNTYSRYTLAVTDANYKKGVYDGGYAFIDYESEEESLKGFMINGITNNDKFWNDFKKASVMYVKIEKTIDCDERVLTFNLSGSMKAYNYIKNHPNLVYPL